MGGYVSAFTEGGMDQKDLLGGKGANLAEMTRLGLPVPPGFTITTEACRAYLAAGTTPDGLWTRSPHTSRDLESAMGRRLGDGEDPLLVSVRSGAKFSMPGMMETVLNIGLNDSSVDGLARTSGSERFAYDSYRRLLQMYGATVLGIDSSAFADELDTAKHERGVTADVDLDADALRALVATYQRIIEERSGRTFPQDPFEQLDGRGARGLRLLEHRAGRALPPPGAHPRGPGDRGQRAGHGVRQPGRVLGLRGLLHPRPVDRAARRLRRLPAERPGRGRRLRDPQHDAARRSSRSSTRSPTTRSSR